MIHDPNPGYTYPYGVAPTPAGGWSAPQPYPAPPKKSRRMLWPVVSLVAVLLAAATVVIVAVIATRQPLKDAAIACNGAGDVQDNGDTMVIDIAGEDPFSGIDTDEGFECLMRELDTPDSVVARMYNTRALDGTQSASWGPFEATWTYHPDQDLDVIITKK